MTILSEFNRLKASKTQIRKAIQRKKTGLKTKEFFETYPPYIASIKPGSKNIDNTGLIDYCEDYKTVFTVTTDSIRDYAFYNWTNLHYIVIDNTELVTLQGEHAFERTNILGIYVPENLVEDYKKAAFWSNYADIITSGTPPEVEPTNLIEHYEHAGRTVEWFNSLTLEQLMTDYR